MIWGGRAAHSSRHAPMHHHRLTLACAVLHHPPYLIPLFYPAKLQKPADLTVKLLQDCQGSRTPNKAVTFSHLTKQDKKGLFQPP